MKLNWDQFKFFIIPGRDPDPIFGHYYKEAYSCWKSVWEDAYKELNVSKYMFSDDFTRQSEINALFYNEECVGMLFLTWADLANPALLNDSYFKLWTKEDLSFLTKNGNSVLICSNTTINKKWRGQIDHLSMKDLLLYLICQRFKNSLAHAMTGITRRTRNVHELTYRFGAVPLRQKVPHFNAEDLVDIVAFYKDSVTEGTDLQVIKLGRRLWADRVEVSRMVTSIPQESKPSKPLKKVA